MIDEEIATGPRSDGADQAHGKKQDGADELEHAVDGNSQQPKWHQDEPDQRIKHESQQSHRPAQHEENAPQQELDHDLSLNPAKHSRNQPWFVTNEASERFPASELSRARHSSRSPGSGHGLRRGRA